MKKRLLIDADSLCYTNGTTYDDAIYRLESKIDKIKKYTELVCDDYTFYLTIGKCFRYDLQVDYKANRIGTKKPMFISELKDYLIDKYNAIFDSNWESDDLVCQEHYDNTESTLIASIDKDLLYNIPGTNFNLLDNTFVNVTTEYSYNFFAKQLIKGDSVDNIPDLLKGFGDVKLDIMFNNLNMSRLAIAKAVCKFNNVEWYDRCRLLYSGTSLDNDKFEVSDEDYDIRIEEILKTKKLDIISNKRSPKKLSLNKKLKLSNDILGKYKMPFGKYKGDTLDFIYETNQNYLIWIVSKFDDNQIKDVISKYLEKK